MPKHRLFRSKSQSHIDKNEIKMKRRSLTLDLSKVKGKEDKNNRNNQFDLQDMGSSPREEIEKIIDPVNNTPKP